jgi:menaquinone-dependent protoporphyrinogen oxidase
MSLGVGSGLGVGSDPNARLLGRGDYRWTLHLAAPVQFRASPVAGACSANERPGRGGPSVSRILLLYSSFYGHTLKIGEFIGAEAATRGDEVVVRPLARGAADAAAYDAIVVGSSIRHGKHHAEVTDFVRANVELLGRLPSAFFSVSLIARKPTRQTPQTNQYVREFVAKSPWQPRLIGIFGGVLDYQRYGVFDRYAIRLIMTLTRGPTDLHTHVEFTDWDKVRAFAAQVSALAARQGAT